MKNGRTHTSNDSRVLLRFLTDYISFFIGILMQDYVRVSRYKRTDKQTKPKNIIASLWQRVFK